MKKILVLFLTAVMLFALAACGEDTSTADTTGTTQTASPETTGEGKAPSDTTGGDTTAAATETDKTTETDAPEHTHSYSSAVTKEASCGEDGTKTFTCSCGDTYTEKIAATGHKWGEWEIKTHAFIDKAGSEERVCSACSSAETRERTQNAIANSFQDGGLQYITWSGGYLNAYFMYPYACHMFFDYIEKPNIPADDVFDLLSKCFDVTDEIKDEIKANAHSWDDYGYDEATDTFFLPYHAEISNFLFVGYKHDGGNKYTIYYSYSDFGFDGLEEAEEEYWSFEVEYNRSNGQPNKYLSAKKVATVPDDIIKTDGWVEFEGLTA